MKKYHTFLLDADDTLFDFAASCQKALHCAMEACGFEYQEAYHAQYLSINNALWSKLERQEITHAELLVLRFSKFLSSLGENPCLSGMLNQAYIKALAEECVPFDGVREFLTALRNLGRIYIVTNGTAIVQRRRFEKFGLQKYAEDIFISEEIGAYKPAEAYFSYVKNHIPKFEQKTALLIGDSLTSDIAMAHAMGVDCVWFNPQNKALQADFSPTFTAKNYGEILKIIQL